MLFIGTIVSSLLMVFMELNKLYSPLYAQIVGNLYIGGTIDHNNVVQVYKHYIIGVIVPST